jgi:hypothetical protein
LKGTVESTKSLLPAPLTLMAALIVAAALFWAGADSTQPHSTTGSIVERSRITVLADGRTLEITVLVDSLVADPDGTMDLLAPGWQGTDGGVVTAAYGTVNQTKWSADDIPVRVTYNPAFDPPGVSARPLVQWAIGVWNSIPGQYFRFTDGGTTSVTRSLCGSDAPDGQNTIRFSTDMPAGALGVTCSVSDGSKLGGVPRVVEFDMNLGTKVPWSTAGVTLPGTYDLNTTVLHELGHALGLDHSTAAGAVMLASLNAGMQRRTPTADDIAGVQALYGLGVTPGPSPSASPGATSTPAPTRTFRLLMPGVAREP